MDKWKNIRLEERDENQDRRGPEQEGGLIPREPAGDDALGSVAAEQIEHHLPVDQFKAGFETMLSGQSGKVILDWAA